MVERSLAEWLEHLGVEATAEQVTRLDQYRSQLWSWNERLNLTRHTTLEKFVTRDVYDSWQLCQRIERGERVLDVGTGGGVPGMVMAILRPDLSIELCESTQKKAAAATQIAAAASVPVVVHACRAEELLEVATYGTLVARAVAPLAKILKWLEPHWDAFDQLLLVKGRRWTDERQAARQAGLLADLELRNVASYATPGTGAESVILKLWRANSQS